MYFHVCRFVPVTNVILVIEKENHHFLFDSFESLPVQITTKMKTDVIASGWICNYLQLIGISNPSYNNKKRFFFFYQIILLSIVVTFEIGAFIYNLICFGDSNDTVRVVDAFEGCKNLLEIKFQTYADIFHSFVLNFIPFSSAAYLKISW